MSSKSYEVAVIGAGIVGLATALKLSETLHERLIVLEAEGRVAAHQTGNNSGVVHSGLYYKPGSLKAQLCTRGREELYRFCGEHGVTHDRCGKVVVATSAAELPALDRLLERGRENGLANLRRLSPEEIREIEPHCSGLGGLRIEETGIVDYVGLAETYARISLERGAEVRLQAKFTKAVAEADGLTLETSLGPIRARRLIACAGLQADRVAKACGVEPGVKIVPFRGEYYELAPERRYLVKNLIYPVPDPRYPFLGVHFTRMAKGGIEAGPNAVLAFKRHGYKRTSFSPRDLFEMAMFGGFWKMSARHWRTGLGEMRRSWSKRAFLAALRRLIPELQAEDIVPAGAGVRAQALRPNGELVDDFHIVSAERMIHVLNAPSPAATASLAIGQSIAERAIQEFGLS